MNSEWSAASAAARSFAAARAAHRTEPDASRPGAERDEVQYVMGNRLGTERHVAGEHQHFADELQPADRER